MKTRRRASAERQPRGRRERDPHHARESQRYEAPLPSREYILTTLEEEAVPVDEKRLIRLLEVKDEERDAFSRRLGAMERDGQILRNRKGALLVAERLSLIAGRVAAHPDGSNAHCPVSATSSESPPARGRPRRLSPSRRSPRCSVRSAPSRSSSRRWPNPSTPGSGGTRPPPRRFDRTIRFR